MDELQTSIARGGGKAPYEPPVVIPLGTLAELTRATASGDAPDAMFNAPVSPP